MRALVSLVILFHAAYRKPNETADLSPGIRIVLSKGRRRNRDETILREIFISPTIRIDLWCGLVVREWRNEKIYMKKGIRRRENEQIYNLFLREKLKYRKIFPLDRKGKNIYNSGKLRVTLVSKLRAKSWNGKKKKKRAKRKKENKLTGKQEAVG